MQTPTSHRALIFAVGGPTELARKLGIYKPVPTTVHWTQRGVPSRYWYRVCEIAADMGIAITPSDLERLPPSDASANAPEAA